MQEIKLTEQKQIFIYNKNINVTRSLLNKRPKVSLTMKHAVQQFEMLSLFLRIIRNQKYIKTGVSP